MLHLYFRKDIPQNYDMALLNLPQKRSKILLRSKLAGLFYASAGGIFRPGTARHSGERH